MATANNYNINIDGVNRLMTNEEKDAYLEWQKLKYLVRKRQRLQRLIALELLLTRNQITRDIKAAQHNTTVLLCLWVLVIFRAT